MVTVDSGGGGGEVHCALQDLSTAGEVGVGQSFGEGGGAYWGQPDSPHGSLGGQCEKLLHFHSVISTSMPKFHFMHLQISRFS